MDKVSGNPIVVALFFIIRCLIPLLIMLGISYLLKKFGLISEPPPPPPEQDDGGEENQLDNENQAEHAKGGPAHGSA